MKWTFREPILGDMIRVAIGSIYHFGIYVSDSEVIQFGLPPSARSSLLDADVEVLASGIDEFLAGGFLEVADFDKKEKKKNRTPEEAIEYARSKLGTRGYHILYNNCEHFANECISGVKVCRQAEDVRAMFLNMPVVDVYIAELPDDAPVGTVECKERRDEIAAVSNERVKREKYFVWKLLCYALERSFGIRGKKLEFTKETWGGWSAKGAEISLSHSDGALAVAVSRAPVGVDIERLRAPRGDRLSELIMTDGELAAYEKAAEDEREEHLIGVWCAKEAIFKSKKLSAFRPKEHDTLKESFKRDTVTVKGEKYVFTVATATPGIVRVYSGIDLLPL